ncbi:DUF3613 domain-containing protein [Comamonas piscis]|uniref:DUF3613 domain-containing protein n=1 Tax=Comamonas piscis TaxID=1562974 RepID=A0A7G5EJC7_9BURK|nr:DUF3613 domain-containing protein [Comamonas piscis]QMV74102.1 DUF3613 domain-containing protein [Comamonas piscis]WSO32541.1 DUF3613 domain-containing protein [Comamonas piscis]
MSPSLSFPTWRAVLLGLAACAGFTAHTAHAESSRAVASVEAEVPSLDLSRQAPVVEVPERASPATQPYIPLATENSNLSLENPVIWRSRPIIIGNATERLLAMQTASRGAHPRPIDGEQASRSYQRYLKSFETKIPERFETGLDVKQ